MLRILWLLPELLLEFSDFWAKRKDASKYSEINDIFGMIMILLDLQHLWLV